MTETDVDAVKQERVDIIRQTAGAASENQNRNFYMVVAGAIIAVAVLAFFLFGRGGDEASGPGALIGEQAITTDTARDGDAIFGTIEAEPVGNPEIEALQRQISALEGLVREASQNRGLSDEAVAQMDELRAIIAEQEGRITEANEYIERLERAFTEGRNKPDRPLSLADDKFTRSQRLNSGENVEDAARIAAPSSVFDESEMEDEEAREAGARARGDAALGAAIGEAQRSSTVPPAPTEAELERNRLRRERFERLVGPGQGGREREAVDDGVIFTPAEDPAQ